VRAWNVCNPRGHLLSGVMESPDITVDLVKEAQVKGEGWLAKSLGENILNA
jgi:hypothetical protein